MNVQPFEIALDDIKYIQPKVHNGELSRSRLEANDVLMTITGRVGTAVVVPKEILPANINQHIVRLRIRENDCLPEYLASWLNTSTGNALINREVTGGTRIALDYKSIQSLQFPLPPLSTQRKLVSEIEAARESRRRKLKEADELLSGIDAYLLETLGLTPPPAETRKIFAVRLGLLKGTQRLNPDYFHPERLKAIITIESAADHLKPQKLSSIVDFRRDLCESASDQYYLGLGHIQSRTGELAEFNEEAEGQCFYFQKDDILFARLRPYLNKVYSTERDGVCSTEFHVMRVKDNTSIQPEYLAAILRSQLILAQTSHMMTGNTHPRLTNDDVVNLIIPVPPLKTQRAIAAEIRRRRDDARRLRAEADAEWSAAKERFEKEILGD